MVPNKPSSLQSFMMAQSTQKKRLAFHRHTLDKDHKMSVLQKIGQLPQDQCIIEKLHLNTKCTRWDHHFHYIQKTLNKIKKITRSTSGMENNGSRHNPRHEIRQIKAKANVKMINNFYHTSEYQLSKDNKFLEIIPGGRLQGYPTSSSHQTQENCNLQS